MKSSEEKWVCRMLFTFFPLLRFFFFHHVFIKKGTAELDLKHHFSIHEKSSSHYVLNGHLGRFNFFLYRNFSPAASEKSEIPFGGLWEKMRLLFVQNDIWWISKKCRKKKKRRKIVTKCIKRRTNLPTTSLSMMIWILSNVIIQSFINHYYYYDAAIWDRAITRRRPPSSLFSVL